MQDRAHPVSSKDLVSCGMWLPPEKENQLKSTPGDGRDIPQKETFSGMGKGSGKCHRVHTECYQGWETRLLERYEI